MQIIITEYCCIYHYKYVLREYYNISFGHLKTLLRIYYFNALTTHCDADDPKTWRIYIYIVCLKFNCALSVNNYISLNYFGKGSHAVIGLYYCGVPAIHLPFLMYLICCLQISLSHSRFISHFLGYCLSQVREYRHCKMRLSIPEVICI